MSFVYKPSTALLEKTFADLLALRDILRVERRAIYEESARSSFHGGVSDEEEDERKRRELDRKDAEVYAKSELVDLLLRPFEFEARDMREAFEKARCDSMMRV